MKVDQGKKRPNESAAKTPVSAKKAKTATPEKTGECIVHIFIFIHVSLPKFFLVHRLGCY